MRLRHAYLVAASLLFAFVWLVTPVVQAGEVNVFYGRKDVPLDIDTSGAPSDIRNALNDLEKQNEWGILTTWGHNWPVAIAVDYLNSSNDESISYTEARGAYTYTYKLKSTNQELDFGVRKYWGEKIQFYVGGGGAWVQGELEVTGLINGNPEFSDSESGNAFGFFANGGVVWRAGRFFNLGLDLRYSKASVDLGEFSSEFGDLDAGGTHYGLFVGGRW